MVLWSSSSWQERVGLFIHSVTSQWQSFDPTNCNLSVERRKSYVPPDRASASFTLRFTAYLESNPSSSLFCARHLHHPPSNRASNRGVQATEKLTDHGATERWFLQVFGCHHSISAFVQLARKVLRVSEFDVSPNSKRGEGRHFEAARRLFGRPASSV